MNRFFIFIYLAFSLSSCSDITPNDPSLEPKLRTGDNLLPAENQDHFDYYKKYFAPAYGSVVIHADQGNALRPNLHDTRSYQYNVSANFIESDMAELMKFPIEIDDVTLSYSEVYKRFYVYEHSAALGTDSKNLNELFGKKLKIKIPGLVEINHRSNKDEFEIYSPQPIELINLPAGDNPLERLKINNRNLNLQWIPDSENEAGLVLIVECQSPLLGTNCKVRNIKSIEDDGQFTLGEEMFQDISDNTLIKLSVMRMSISLDDLIDTDDPLKIVAYTEVGDGLVLVD